MSTWRTSLTMLADLGDPSNRAAWEQFDATYRPMLMGFGRHLGLDPNDADEAAQRATIAFCESFQQGKYDRDKGRLRNWLLGIAQHEIANLHAERARQPIPASQRSSLDAAFSRLRDPQSVSLVWERQWQEHVLSVCLQQAGQNFTSRDLRIFEMLTTDQLGTNQVADKMDLTPAAVYKVKYRVLEFIGEVKAELEGGDRG